MDYSPKSYVGIRRGRRVWAPLWFRRDGALVYLPDPDGLRGEQQSPAMDDFQERLRKEGLETSWQPTCNAGANAVPIRLRTQTLPSPWCRNCSAPPFRSWLPGRDRGRHWLDLCVSLRDRPVTAL